MTTGELARALQRREAGAFEQLLGCYGPMLHRVARRLTGQTQDAEDVVQEALVTVYAKIDTLDNPAALAGWLRRIVVNAALMRVRAQDREPPAGRFRPEEEFTAEGDHAGKVADWSFTPEQTVIRREALAILRREVERLPTGARAVYVLAEIEGLSYEETAALLDISVGTVRVRLHRARLALRGVLARYFAERHPGFRSVSDLEEDDR